MREIKFRSWLKDKKEMLYDFTTLSNNVFSEDDRHTLMQYTGLKDKNGKEIYEGDIVSYLGLKYEALFKFGLKYEVLFKNGAFGWMEDGVFYSFNEMARTVFNKFEIIGNVYENPELLEESK